MSSCADDPTPLAMDFISGAIAGRYETKNVSIALMAAINSQTSGTLHFKQLDDLGPIVNSDILERKDVPQGSGYTIRVKQQHGNTLWTVVENRITHQIDTASFTPDPAIASAPTAAPSPTTTPPPICTASVVKVFNLGDQNTLDGSGNVVGNISAATVSVLRECNGATAEYRIRIAYQYYNGSGTWRGEQHINTNMLSEQGANILSHTSPLDRSRCIYGSSESRVDEFPVGDVATLITSVKLEISRVAHVQTRC